MDTKQKEALNKIVASEGDCLDLDNCRYCPFTKECMLLFLFADPWPRKEREARALDALARLELMNDSEL